MGEPPVKEDFQIGRFVVFQPRPESMEEFDNLDEALTYMKDNQEWAPSILFQVVETSPADDAPVILCDCQAPDSEPRLISNSCPIHG